MRLLIIALIIYLPFAGSVGAAGSCGTCDLPESLEGDAKYLRNDFGKLSFQELQDQQILETLCDNNSCGSLNEGQASRLLDRAIAYEKAESETRERWEAKWVNRGLTVFSIFIAWLAYWQSRKAKIQSVRNRVEIEHLVKDTNDDRIMK